MQKQFAERFFQFPRVIVSEQLSQLGPDELSGLSHVCAGQSGERNRVISGHAPGAMLRQPGDSAGVKRLTMAAGEARDADIGIAAGNKRGHLFVKGTNVAVVPENEMVEALVEWAEFIHEHGTDAAIARANVAKAQREARLDRDALLVERGDDANHSGQRIDLIRKTTA